MQDDRQRKASTDTNPDPEGPLDEIRLPPHAPAKGRKIDDPPARRKKQKAGQDPADLPEDEDDTTGEMASAGQDLGLVVEEEREATSVEDSGLEDEESDWIDHDDDTDKGRGH